MITGLTAGVVAITSMIATYDAPTVLQGALHLTFGLVVTTVLVGLGVFLSSTD